MPLIATMRYGPRSWIFYCNHVIYSSGGTGIAPFSRIVQTNYLVNSINSTGKIGPVHFFYNSKYVRTNHIQREALLLHLKRSSILSS
ncbi:hypothetical protein K439DRAFT_891224 [Ramaria rubella]|nr:hypothetical protein K439DRAFT_891224 [Ramaria rubella]